MPHPPRNDLLVAPVSFSRRPRDGSVSCCAATIVVSLSLHQHSSPCCLLQASRDSSRNHWSDSIAPLLSAPPPPQDASPPTPASPLFAASVTSRREAGAPSFAIEHQPALSRFSSPFRPAQRNVDAAAQRAAPAPCAFATPSPPNKPTLYSTVPDTTLGSSKVYS